MKAYAVREAIKLWSPPGVLVTSLPEGAATVTVNGSNYREFGKFGIGHSTAEAT